MITMNDIAARVGVSQAMVSYVLNGRKSGPPVRQEMRERILKTAEELGYRRNELARAMVSGKNYVLGFITHVPGDENSTRIMLGAQEEAMERGYLIKMLPMPGFPDYAQAFARLAEQRLAGVMALNFKGDAVECLREETQRFGMPVVLVDDPPPQNWAPSVVCDDADGLSQAIAHLRQLGHRRIAFVSAQSGSPLAEQRRTSFLRLMEENGLPVPETFVVATNWKNQEIIERELRPLLEPGRDPSTYPTALVCAGDFIAMVALRVARSLGFRLPGDLSIVGFADFLFASYADPPLTTIAQPYEEMGRLGVRCLLDPSALSTVSTIRVPTRLIIRGSTGEAREHMSGYEAP
jgi:LacI family transcriptional regulator